MKTTSRGFCAVLLCLTVICIAAALLLKPDTADAVEYVRICPLYGPGFEYLPGTDVCVNFSTADARQQTEDETWRWRMPDNPKTWVPSAQGACQGGQLMKLGDFSASALTFNSHDRYETAQTPLNLKPGQYIGSVLYKGGFSGPGVDGGNFCMFYYYNDPTLGPVYTPFGCEDTGQSAAAAPTVLQFTPDNPTPPQTTNALSVLGANGNVWSVPPDSQSNIQGTLSIWLCVQSAH